MTVPVLLTIDTELTWRHLARGASWEENWERSFDPAGVGVPYQLAMLARHGLKACFFVDPMPAVRYGIEPVRRMVEPILAAGQEVQLHLHPFWQQPEGTKPVFELNALSAALQHDMIRQARDLLIEAGAPPPIAFRAGSYAADAATLEALAALGIRYDSSHNGSHHPHPSNLPFDPALIDPIEHDGVIEVPVTQIAEAGGGLRHLQLCAVSFAEIRAALRHANDAGHRAVTIVSHSFELASRDGLRPNNVYRRRFEALCRYLGDRRDTLPTAHFTDLGDIAAPVRSRPLPPKRLREARRRGAQVWADTRYERPGSALTAVTGSTLAGLEIIAAMVVR